MSAVVRARGGFSLVEVLIAVIVLAVGLLGMAGLQISALKANESSRYRSIATEAILDLIDRLRADPAAVLGSNGLQKTLVWNTCATPPTVRWQKEFCAFGLPAPASSANVLEINCNASGANGCGRGNCQVIVRWDDTRADPRSPDGQAVAARNAEFSVCTRLPAL